MPPTPISLTPYPDVNAVLQLLIEGVQEVLGEQLTGLYLHGSLAGGDFNPRRSDIDFVAVTRQPPTEQEIALLDAMHRRMRATGLAWASHMEGSYIHQSALRRYDPQDNRYPALRIDGSFEVDTHGPDWIIQRHILCERGIALVGPPPRTLLDPVSTSDIVQAQIGTLRDWWQPILSDPAFIRDREYQAYAVLTMCRALYTLKHGDTTSKTKSVLWALENVEPRWRERIHKALAWPEEPQEDAISETLEFIAFTLDAAENAARTLENRPISKES